MFVLFEERLDKVLVLTPEHPCLDHIQLSLELAQQADGLETGLFPPALPRSRVPVNDKEPEFVQRRDLPEYKVLEYAPFADRIVEKFLLCRRGADKREEQVYILFGILFRP